MSIDADNPRNTQDKIHFLELESIYNFAPIGLCVFDDQLRYVRINDKFAEIHGVLAEQHIGRTPREIVPKLADQAEAAYKRIMKTGEPVLDVKVRSDIADQPGIFRTWNERWFPLKDEKGTIVRINVFVVDILGHFFLEEELYSDQNKFYNIFDMISDGVYIVNRNYDIEYINSILKKEFGEVSGRKCYEYFHQREKVCPWCKNEDVFKEKTIRWEWYSPRNQKTYDLIDTPLKNPDGTISKLEIFRDITERKQIEKVLKESEANLARAQSIAHLANWELDIQTEEIRGSAELYRMFNLEQEPDFTLSGFVEKCHPDDRAYIAKSISAAIFEGRPYNIDYRIIPRPGDIRHVHAEGQVTRDRAGVPIKFFGTVQDITKRKRDQEAVEEAQRSLERQRSLLQSMIDSAKNSHLVYLDRNFNFVCVNETYARRCGYTPDEMVGKNHFTLYPNEENEAIFAGVRDSGIPVEFRDKPFVFPDQPERDPTYWDWSLVPVKDPSGNIEGLVLSLFETTERKWAEEKLRKSEANMAWAQKIAQLGNWDWDLKTNTLSCSDEHYRMYGLVPGDYPIEAFVNRVHEDDRQYIKDSLAATLDTGEPYDVECRIVRPDGSTRILYGKGEAIYDEKGQPKGMFGIALDITDRKRMEQDLRQLNESLEQKVAERTKLAEDRAEQLRTLVTELTLAEERERRRLAEVLHDDLQQLLVGARINCELLSESIDEEEKPVAQTVLSLLNQSIQASRSLTAELSPPALHEGRFSAALEWLAGWMYTNYGLTIKLELEPETAPIGENIASLIFRSIRELLFNVVKHGGVKSAQVNLSHTVDHMLRATVIDEGLGFDPGTVLENVKGETGFGLLSIRERLEMIGGRFEIESAPGKGAIFSLLVPLSSTRNKNKQ